MWERGSSKERDRKSDVEGEKRKISENYFFLSVSGRDKEKEIGRLPPEVILDIYMFSVIFLPERMRREGWGYSGFRAYSPARGQPTQSIVEG